MAYQFNASGKDQNKFLWSVGEKKKKQQLDFRDPKKVCGSSHDESFVYRKEEAVALAECWCRITGWFCVERGMVDSCKEWSPEHQQRKGKNKQKP